MGKIYFYSASELRDTMDAYAKSGESLQGAVGQILTELPKQTSHE